MILDIDNLLQGLFLKQKKIMILRLNGKKKHNLFSRFVSSPEEVLEVIEEGKSNRHVAVTSNLFLLHIYIFLHMLHTSKLILIYKFTPTYTI